MTADRSQRPLTRADVLASRRATREAPPLVRNEASETFDEDRLEVPAATSDQFEETRVLLVDDNADLTAVTKQWLERLDDNFTVTCTTNAVAALDILDDADIDCVISDYDMSTTDGIELLEITREQYPDLPFILYTGKGSEEVASEAIAAGVTDYMQKDGGVNHYEVLANRVQNAVEQYRTQQQFWDALSWYRRLVEQDVTGVFIVQDDELVYVNQYLADGFGYDRATLVGSSPLMLAAKESDERVLQEAVNVEDDDTFKCEFNGRRADGDTVPVEIQGGTVTYGGNLAVIAVLWDHSDNKV